jgi:hypothetical protein
MGHCLRTGIVDEDRAELIGEGLVSDEMFSDGNPDGTVASAQNGHDACVSARLSACANRTNRRIAVRTNRPFGVGQVSGRRRAGSMQQCPWGWGRLVVVHPAGNLVFAEACARYRDLLVDQSTFSSMTVEELLDADVLPPQTAAALRARYILG